jgi:hypothetical protein
MPILHPKCMPLQGHVRETYKCKMWMTVDEGRWLREALRERCGECLQIDGRDDTDAERTTSLLCGTYGLESVCACGAT